MFTLPFTIVTRSVCPHMHADFKYAKCSGYTPSPNFWLGAILIPFLSTIGLMIGTSIPSRSIVLKSSIPCSLSL